MDGQNGVFKPTDSEGRASGRVPSRWTIQISVFEELSDLQVVIRDLSTTGRSLGQYPEARAVTMTIGEARTGAMDLQKQMLTISLNHSRVVIRGQRWASIEAAAPYGRP